MFMAFFAELSVLPYNEIGAAKLLYADADDKNDRHTTEHRT